MSGLTDAGLEIEAIDDIRTGLEADLRDTFFASLPLGDKTLLGHMNGIVSEQAGLGWERLEQINSQQDDTKATGSGLEGLSLLTGTYRRPAAPSFATLALCGDPATLVLGGSTIATLSTKIPFNTAEDVTLVGLAAWLTATPYVVDDEVTNGVRCYRCITAGTSAAVPTTTAADITDGTVHWQYLGEGTATVDVLANAQDTGPQVAVSGDLTDIKSTTTGWKSARNLLDATLGAAEALDEELRITRRLELAGNGATTSPALAARLRKIANVTSVKIFNNRSDATDGNGLPPHSFEVLILGGDAQTIVNTIGDNQADGVATFSFFGTSGSYTDSEGNTEAIYYSRPAAIAIYVYLVITYDATLYPSDGDSQIKTALAVQGQQTYAAGSDVDATSIGNAAFTVAGVRGVRPLVYIDAIQAPVAWTALHAYIATVGSRSVVTNDSGRVYICITAGTSAGAGGPTGTAADITDGTVHWQYLGPELLVSVDARHIATFDTTRVNVNSAPVTP